MQDSGSTGFWVMSLYQQGLKLPADRSGKNVRLSPDELLRDTFEKRPLLSNLCVRLKF
jgi:hypothetical protein